MKISDLIRVLTFQAFRPDPCDWHYSLADRLRGKKVAFLSLGSKSFRLAGGTVGDDEPNFTGEVNGTLEQPGRIPKEALVKARALSRYIVIGFGGEYSQSPMLEASHGTSRQKETQQASLSLDHPKMEKRFVSIRDRKEINAIENQCRAMGLSIVRVTTIAHALLDVLLADPRIQAGEARGVIVDDSVVLVVDVDGDGNWSSARPVGHAVPKDETEMSHAFKTMEQVLETDSKPSVLVIDKSSSRLASFWTSASSKRFNVGRLESLDADFPEFHALSLS